MQQLTRERLPRFGLGKGTDAAANTRKVTSFLVWAHTKKIRKKEKIEKEENPKKSKQKKFKKKNLFLVVLDKICVFCLYPISDPQQYVKRGSYRRPILSGLLCLFLFWVSGPFVTSFEFGSRTLSIFTLSSFRVFSRINLCFVLIFVLFVVSYVILLRIKLCHFIYLIMFRSLIRSFNQLYFVLVVSLN